MTGDEFRQVASVFDREAIRLRRAADSISVMCDPTVFDGVMQSSYLQNTGDSAARLCRTAADESATLAVVCRGRAAVADEWAHEYRRYLRAADVWRLNVERSGVGARPEPPTRPAPWISR